MLLVYNYVLLKMSTWYSKHVEESNNIWRINNIQCITLVVLYGPWMCVHKSAPLNNTLMRKRIQSRFAHPLPLRCNLIFFLTPTICDTQVCGTAPLTNSVLLTADVVSVSKGNRPFWSHKHPVHTLRTLPYDRSIVSSKASSPQSAI